MDKDDKDKFNKGNSDDFIIRRKETPSNDSPKRFDEPILRKAPDNKPKSTLVTPSESKKTIVVPDRKPQQQNQRQMYSATPTPNKESEQPKRPQLFEDFGMRRREEQKETKPDLDILGRPRANKPELQPKPQPKPEQKTPNLYVDKDIRLGNMPKPIKPQEKPLVQDPNAKKIEPIKVHPVQPEGQKPKVQFIKPELRVEKEEEIEILGGKKPEQKPIPKPQPKSEPEVIKTTTSTLEKPKKELPEDKSKEAGAKAGSKKYKADTRLNKHAKSLKKYNKEFEKWRKSQEEPLVEEYGDVKVQESRNSERVITTSLILVVLMILSLFLLFYCNIINPTDQEDDGRVRISVDIDDDAFLDVDAYGNIIEREIFPGDYIDFNIVATNAYNIKGDNATEFTWDTVFVRYKIYLRIDGVAYETVKVNISNQGEKDVPVIIPTIDGENFQTYDKEKEDEFTDPITGEPIVTYSDGYYYYNGLLSYNQNILLCTGVLFNGDAIIPEFATKDAELVVEIQSATADYTSIRERTIWDKAPQTWINYIHKYYFSNIS